MTTITTLIKKAREFEKKIKEIPEQSYYEVGSKYFCLLEKRNELLDEVTQLLNKEGYNLPKLRIHQKDARYIYEAVMEYIKTNTSAEDLLLRDVMEQLKKKKKETYEHSKRVGNFMFQFAKFRGYSEEEAMEMKKAGMLHDAGKLLIPDSILNKPGMLNEEERKVINTHIIKGLYFLEKGSEIVQNCAKFHHTHYQNAPMEAQICAVCDVYDALTSKRCYKEAKSKCEAYSIMKNTKTLNQSLVEEFFKMLIVEKRKTA